MQKDGGLTDESLAKLLAIITDQKEGELIRHMLVGMLSGPYREHLTDEQYAPVARALMTVLSNTLSQIVGIFNFHLQMKVISGATNSTTTTRCTN